MIADNSSWLDRDGLLKSHASWSDSSGDGIIITVVGGLLKVVPIELVDAAVYKCIDPTSGLLHRRPDGSGGQTSHDSWAALAVWLQYRGDAVRARGLLVSALIRGCYMNNTPLGLETTPLWKDKIKRLLAPALIRFPRIWIILTVAAFQNRFVAWCGSRLILILQSFDSVRLEDASSCQLSWINLYSVMLSGNPLPLRSFLREFRDRKTSLADTLARDFWDQSHVVITGYRAFEQEVLNG